MEDLYRQTKALFDNYYAPAHDFKHAQRVSKLAQQIAEAEGYDVKEAEVAGLLHDVGRTVKDSTAPHAHLGVPIARELLNNYTDFSEEAKKRILKAIEVHSDLETEGNLNNIVQDADKLDGMGALGVNRAYIGLSQITDFENDNIIPKEGNYKPKTIHEFMALQLEWYDMLYTDKAREIGKPRQDFMIAFLEEFKREVEETK